MGVCASECKTVAPGPRHQRDRCSQPMRIRGLCDGGAPSTGRTRLEKEAPFRAVGDLIGRRPRCGARLCCRPQGAARVQHGGRQRGAGADGGGRAHRGTRGRGCRHGSGYAAVAQCR